MGLSDDATPTLVDALPNLDSDQRETLELYLRDRDAVAGGDWRTWSWSRHRADAALKGVP